MMQKSLIKKNTVKAGIKGMPLHGGQIRFWLLSTWNGPLRSSNAPSKKRTSDPQRQRGLRSVHPGCAGDPASPAFQSFFIDR